MIVMCSYSKLSDLGRPLQDDLGKDTKKKDLVNKSLKKKNSAKRKWLYKKWFAMGKGQCSWMLEGKRRVMSDEEGDRCMQGIIGHGEEFGFALGSCHRWGQVEFGVAPMVVGRERERWCRHVVSIFPQFFFK